MQADVDADRVLRETGISPQIRPEELTPEQCMRLFEGVGRPVDP